MVHWVEQEVQSKGIAKDDLVLDVHAGPSIILLPLLHTLVSSVTPLSGAFPTPFSR